MKCLVGTAIVMACSLLEIVCNSGVGVELSEELLFAALWDGGSFEPLSLYSAHRTELSSKVACYEHLRRTQDTEQETVHS